MDDEFDPTSDSDYSVNQRDTIYEPEAPNNSRSQSWRLPRVKDDSESSMMDGFNDFAHVAGQFQPHQICILQRTTINRQGTFEASLLFIDCSAVLAMTGKSSHPIEIATRLEKHMKHPERGNWQACMGSIIHTGSSEEVLTFPVF